MFAPRTRGLAALLSAVLLAGCTASGPAISSAPAAMPVEALARHQALAPAAAGSGPMPRPGAPVPSAEPLAAYALNLYRDGDFVPQHTFEWCVGASMQMTLNIVLDAGSASAEDQGELWTMARDRSNDRWGGASGRGWATSLNELGAGPYELTSFNGYEEALREAAYAIRTTERPVGLIVWRGRHAWLMSGFTSIGDPAVDKDFVVTGINVLDPLYPYGDANWGPSPEPNSLLTPEELGRQFKARDRMRWGPDSPTGFVMVLPTPPDG